MRNAPLNHHKLKKLICGVIRMLRARYQNKGMNEIRILKSKKESPDSKNADLEKIF